ncbi:MAG: Hsp20/alpha crystallin family protein [bacterium]|nr:Hsp20/alpha crystallin family protein [bacterium]
MDLIPLRPFRELSAVEDETSRLLDYFFGRRPMLGSRERAWAPLIDVRETKDSLIAEVDLPGVDPKDVDISVEGRTLSIKGEKKVEREEKEGGYRYYERYSGSFHRTATLPDEVDPARTKAGYKDGVLTVTMPKSEVAKARKIKIE